MTALRQRFLDHLSPLAGELADFAPVAASHLPLFLRENYDFQNACLWGKPYLFAFEKEKQESASPGEYENTISLLQPHFQETVVLVLHRLTSYARNRMVRAGVPFVVPGSQAFLPAALMDLRERFGPAPSGKREKLTPAAQCLVLYHLQRQSLEKLPLREIAEKIGYSPIMLTKVKDELEATGTCQISRIGRSMILEFSAHGRDLWECFQPFLSSPVKKTLWARWNDPQDPARVSGLTALSRRTLMADDRLPTYALHAPTFQSNLEQGIYHGCQGSEEANVRLESWSYNPLLLGDTEMVDPLSLHLSLRNFPDERIQQQLETLIDQMSW
jgi:hypothetical protein